MTVLTRAGTTVPIAVFALMSMAVFVSPSTAQAPAAGQSSSSGGLDLNAAQRTQADARQAQFQKDIAALRADKTSTDAQKQAKYVVLYQAMDKDMMALLTPAQRSQVQKQREINAQFQKDVTALQSDKTMTDAQKKARYLVLVQNARNASLALMTPAQRAAALKRAAEATKLQQAQAVKLGEVKRLGLQLQKSETPAQSEKLRTIGLTTGAAIQSVIADKTLSNPAKTAKIVALRKDALSHDLALLTPSQRTLYGRIQAMISPTASQ
ncbi:MAG: hypothetical protein ACRYFS_25730 [Janthinobacterium lividum]